MGHLVVEKLLKALFVSVHGISTITPRIHNLLVLAKKANLDLTEKQEDLLDLISTFNINARYGDYKQAFYKKCTQKYTQECKKEIEVLVVWLKSLV